MEMDATNPTMPPEIAKAIVKVMGEVKKLGKDAENTHGSYKYVSVDQFFDQVGKLMAEAGIFVLVNEADFETKARDGKSAWLSTSYDISIAHESGVMYGPLRRHLMANATGPQAFGAALAYVEKYFLRNLFKIPTGEADADADAQDGLPATPKRPQRPPRPPEPANAPMSLEDSQVARDEMLDAIEKHTSAVALEAWSISQERKFHTLMMADKEAIHDAYGAKMQELKGKAAA